MNVIYGQSLLSETCNLREALSLADRKEWSSEVNHVFREINRCTNKLQTSILVETSDDHCRGMYFPCGIP